LKKIHQSEQETQQQHKKKFINLTRKSIWARKNSTTLFSFFCKEEEEGNKMRPLFKEEE
jgi:hypothetical protein